MAHLPMPYCESPSAAGCPFGRDSLSWLVSPQ